MKKYETLPLREALRVLVRKLGILEKSEAACCQLSLTQCHSITEVGRAGEMSLGALAELLQLEKSTLSRTVNQLVDNGLLVREADSGDRRYVAITLSEAGEKIYEQNEESMLTYYGGVLEKIPADKRGQVLESLVLLNEALSVE